MDAREEEINTLREQLNSLDIPKDLVLPELKLAFADLVDELEALAKRKESNLLLLDHKQEELNKLRQ